MIDDNEYTYQYISYRNIWPETFKFFGIEAKIDSSGRPIEFAFPYPSGAYQIRDLTKPKRESFRVVGDSDKQRTEACLIGRDKFPAGVANAVTIVEGSFDLPATYQMLGSKYPCVSVRSSSTARKDCEAEFEWLNSFSKIYLAFDGDTAGTEAKLKVAELFDFNKVYDVKLPDGMDPDDFNQQNRQDEFKRSDSPRRIKRQIT